MKDPGCSSRIPALDFFSIPDPGSRGQIAADPGSAKWAGNKDLLINYGQFSCSGSGSQFPIPYKSKSRTAKSMRGDPDPPLYLGLSWQILPMQKKACCESVYSENICLSNYLIICHNLGPVSPTVAGASGGVIEMKHSFFCCRRTAASRISWWRGWRRGRWLRSMKFSARCVSMALGYIEFAFFSEPRPFDECKIEI